MIFLLLLLLLGLVGNGKSQERQKVTKFVILNGLYAASAAADAQSTNAMLVSGCCYEVNPLFGRRPSPVRVWGQGAAITAGFVGIDYLLFKKKSRLWWVLPVAGIALHSTLAYHNYQLPR